MGPVSKRQVGRLETGPTLIFVLNEVTMSLVRAACTGGFLVTLLAVAGCGDNSGLVEVKGAVTLDGAPLEKGAISFSPVDGKTKTAGTNITAGKYSAQVPLGTMKVAISAGKVVGKKPLYDRPGSRERDVIEEIVPARYNEETELRLEVKPGGVEKNWDLRSK